MLFIGQSSMMKSWKFGYVPEGFESKEQTVSILSSLGYRAVEYIWGFGERSDFCAPSEVIEVANLSRGKGLVVSDVHCGEDFVTLDENLRKEKIRSVKEKIKIVKQAGIPMINQFTGPAYWTSKPLKLGREVSEGRAWSMVLDAFNEIIGTAEENEVYVGVEACSGMLCHDYYTIQELLRRISSKYLVVTMDPSWYQLAGNDIPWLVGRLSDKIKHVHLKDVVGVPGNELQEYMFPLLGEGVIDWKSFFTALEQINYDGYLSVEFESMHYFRRILDGEGARAAEISMELLKKLTST